MPKTDPRVDAYIANAEPFAQPVLNHLRRIVHAACPNAEETMKWSFPHFDYNGQMMCSMASFKKHCAFGFWKAQAMSDPHKLFNPEVAMGHLGKITSVKDLPSQKILTQYIKEAMKLNDEGVKFPGRVKAPANKELAVPEYFTKTLSKNKAARKNFDAFPYSHKKDYVEWITEAKTDATREKRMATAVEWITEGKSRNWKYERK